MTWSTMRRKAAIEVSTRRGAGTPSRAPPPSVRGTPAGVRYVGGRCACGVLLFSLHLALHLRRVAPPIRAPDLFTRRATHAMGGTRRSRLPTGRAAACMTLWMTCVLGATELEAPLPPPPGLSNATGPVNDTVSAQPGGPKVRSARCA